MVSIRVLRLRLSDFIVIPPIYELEHSAEIDDIHDQQEQQCKNQGEFNQCLAAARSVSLRYWFHPPVSLRYWFHPRFSASARSRTAENCDAARRPQTQIPRKNRRLPYAILFRIYKCGGSQPRCLERPPDPQRRIQRSYHG